MSTFDVFILTRGKPSLVGSVQFPGDPPKSLLLQSVYEDLLSGIPYEKIGGTYLWLKIKSPDSSGHFVNKDISLYDAAFKRLTRALFRGGMTEFEFVDNLFSSMRQNFLDAWQEGRDAVKAGPMTDDDKLRVQDIVAEQAAYAPGFAQYVTKVCEDGGKFGDLLLRAQMWIGKYQEVKAEAMVSARGKQRLMWKWNPQKEHCPSCADLNGRVYTAATWAKQNIRPRSRLLECGGYWCGCEFVPTDAPITKGPFPALIGNPRRKSLEEMVYKFDPSQPRDESGRWMDGGVASRLGFMSARGIPKGGGGGSGKTGKTVSVRNIVGSPVDVPVGKKFWYYRFGKQEACSFTGRTRKKVDKTSLIYNPKPAIQYEVSTKKGNEWWSSAQASDALPPSLKYSGFEEVNESDE